MNPYQPPPVSFLRAARGPMVLMTLGILLAVDHFGNWTFSKTWPVLLILYAGMLLADRLFTSRPEQSEDSARSRDRGIQ